MESPRSLRLALGVGALLMFGLLVPAGSLTSALGAVAPGGLASATGPSHSLRGGSAADPHLASSPGSPHFSMATVPLRSDRPGPDDPSGTPGWLAFDPNDDAFWVAVGPSSVDVIQATNPYGPPLVLPVGTDPFGVAVDPAADLVFVTNAGSNNVTEISDVTNRTVGSTPVGGEPQGVAVDAGAGVAFVADAASDNVSIISVGTLTTTTSVPVGPDPIGVTFDPASNRVFVADWDGFSLSVISPATDTLVATVPVGIDPYAVAIDTATDNVYVTNPGSENLSVVNATTGAFVASVPIASGGSGSFSNDLEGIAYDPDTGMMWVGDGWWYLVLVNTTTESVTDFYTVDPCGLAWDGVDHAIGLTNTLNTTFAVLSAPRGQPAEGSFRVTETGLPVGTPWSVAIANESGPGPTTTSAQTLTLNAQTSYYLVVPPTAGYAVTHPQFWATSGDGSTVNGTSVSFVKTSLYPVNFLESGLPAGTGWAIDLADDMQTTPNASLSFGLPNGTTPYWTVAPDGYHPVSNGNGVQVAGAEVNVTVDFAPNAGYELEFSETGLPTWAEWYVNATRGPPGIPLPASGPMSYASEVVPGFANGSYVLTVQTNSSDYRSASTVSLSVYDGVPFPASAVDVVFSPVTYAVPFQAYGLPVRTSWSVTLDGMQENASTGSLVFAVTNGSYEYSVGAPDGYSVAPATGPVDVTGHNVSAIGITFTSTETYAITFRETGLPNGTGWAVAIGSQLESSTNATVQLFELNGTYDFVILDVPGFTTNYSGAVSVRSGPTPVNISFAPQTYPVIVVEAGLPPGTNWSLTVANASTGFHLTKSTNGSALLFFLPNGSYALTVSVPPGYSANVTSATFTVAGGVATAPSVGFAPSSGKPAATYPATSSGPPPYALGAGPWVLGLVAVAMLGVVGTALLMARRGRPPAGSFPGPSGPLPADPSFPPAATGPSPSRDPRRPSGDGPAAPLDDVF